MKLHGTQADLFRTLSAEFPTAPAITGVRVQMLPYQMIALYGLAQALDKKGASVLEIGTGQGGSAYLLARAMPEARIVSLTTNPAEAELARRFLAASHIENVEVRVQPAMELLQEQNRTRWTMVWVDGDHNQIARDLPWFNRLEVGGLFLCHDWSPAESAHPSPVVYQALVAFGQALGRPADVEIVDETLTGMAGWYRRKGEMWRG